jgi:hypothetical protein
MHRRSWLVPALIRTGFPCFTPLKLNRRPGPNRDKSTSKSKRPTSEEIATSGSRKLKQTCAGPSPLSESQQEKKRVRPSSTEFMFADQAGKIQRILRPADLKAPPKVSFPLQS